MDFTLLVSFQFFFADLTTEAVKSKKCKSFPNSNDFEDKKERNPCFNNYLERRKENSFPAQKSSYSHDCIM